MRKFATLLLIVVMTTTCIGCDQLTKDYARENLMHGATVTIVDDLVHLVYAENPGIAFGIGAGLSSDTRFWLFNVGIFSILVLIAGIAYYRRRQGPLFLSGVTLILAGGASNLIDRLLHGGHVVDFLVVDVGALRSIVFNFADVLVLCGAVSLVVSAVRTHARDLPALQRSQPVP